jgi:hypothetical protein
MSCWVVPTIAAEIWGMPLSELLRRIRDGEIPTKQDAGFTFVDVAPYSNQIERPLLPPDERPATFTSLSDAEMAALERELVPQDAAAADEPVIVVVDEDQLPDETQSKQLGDWRTARSAAARKRTPPRITIDKAA